MTSAALLADTERVYRSREKDVWEILENAGQYTWRRTATNKEIVGSSHKPAATLQEAEQNAMLFGYEGVYNVSNQTEWNFYRDERSEYRWTATYNGQVINEAHEGYVSEKACLLNAVRHGYRGHLDSKSTNKMQNTAHPKTLTDMLEDHTDNVRPVKQLQTDTTKTSDSFFIVWGVVFVALILLLGYFLSIL